MSAGEKIPASVLIIEDDLGIRTAMGSALELEGYRVTLAENGQVGLDCLRSWPHPDLVLLDFRMPVMDGQEFLESVREDRELAEIPVVMISASIEEIRGTGATQLLRKPVDLDELLDTVSRYAGDRNLPVVAALQ